MGNNFVCTMLRAGAERPELRVVADQHGTPTAAPDLADAIAGVLARLRETGWRPEYRGVLHAVAGGATTWHAFAEAIFAGARTGEELARHYASADVFLFPSVTETFGNVVLEALAAGLPPVAYDYAGPRQLIRHSRNGWLAPLGDEAAFLECTRAAAIDWSDAGRRAEARAAALKHGWPQVIEQFEAELQAVLPARP